MLFNMNDLNETPDGNKPLTIPQLTSQKENDSVPSIGIVVIEMEFEYDQRKHYINNFLFL